MAGIICTGETYKDKVKLTFARGALLDDPSGLFNASLEGGTRRAIDLREGEEIDEPALQGAGPRSRHAECVEGPALIPSLSARRPCPWPSRPESSARRSAPQ